MLTFQFNKHCVLCAQDLKSNQGRDIIKTYLSGSRKPVKTVLNHLLLCLKKSFTFSPEAFVCRKCFENLSNYDSMMASVTKSQNELMQMLDKSLFCSQKRMNIVALEKEDTPQSTTNSEVESKQPFTEIENTFDNNPFDNCTDPSGNDCTSSSSDDELRPVVKTVSKSPVAEKVTKTVRCIVDNCNKGFRKRKTFEKHMRTQHQLKPKIVCAICKTECHSEEYLDVHMNIHEGKTERECRICGQIFTRRKNLVRHMTLHSGRKMFQCEKCGERFVFQCYLDRHTRKVHENIVEPPVKCEQCEQVFKGRRVLERHMDRHKPDRQRYNCEFCLKTFTAKFSVRTHIKPAHPAELPMWILKESSRNRSALAGTSRNEEVTPQMPMCIICGKRSETRESHQKHMKSYHDVILDKADLP